MSWSTPVSVQYESWAQDYGVVDDPMGNTRALRRAKAAFISSFSPIFSIREIGSRVAAGLVAAGGAGGTFVGRHKAVRLNAFSAAIPPPCRRYETPLNVCRQ